MSVKVTVAVPPAAIADCSAAVAARPRSKVTLASSLAITASVAIVVVPTFSTAVPPVAWPAVMVAEAVRLVLVAFSVLATTVPPEGVNVTAVGKVGAT